MGKNQDPGSGINIPDPQHWLSVYVAAPAIPFYFLSISTSAKDVCHGHQCLYPVVVFLPDLTEIIQLADPFL
jgi:hypothetical protein